MLSLGQPQPHGAGWTLTAGSATLGVLSMFTNCLGHYSRDTHKTINQDSFVHPSRASCKYKDLNPTQTILAHSRNHYRQPHSEVVAFALSSNRKLQIFRNTQKTMAEHHYKFNVQMTCGGCSGAVERVLKKLDGRPILLPTLSPFLPSPCAPFAFFLASRVRSD